MGVGPSMLGGEEQATTKAMETIRNAIARANRRIVIPHFISSSMLTGSGVWSKIDVLKASCVENQPYCLPRPDIRIMLMASQNQLKDVPESDVDSLDLSYCDPELPVGIRE